MQLERDPVSILGLRYEDVRLVVGGTAPMQILEDPDPEGEDELYARAPDGRWECTLDQDGNVESVFLFGDKGCAFPMGLSAGMTPSDVRSAIGDAPSKSNSARDVPGLGWIGAFMRWDRPTYSMHAEFDTSGRLKLLTFMHPQRVPGR